MEVATGGKRGPKPVNNDGVGQQEKGGNEKPNKVIAKLNRLISLFVFRSATIVHAIVDINALARTPMSNNMRRLQLQLRRD
jgi:hypothetical protein